MQDLRDHRGEQKVGGTALIGLQAIDFVGQEGGDENDGNIGRAGPLVNGLGRFEAVHAGHVDVEQDHGEVVQQDLAQRLLTGARRDHVVTGFVRPLIEQAGQSQQAARIVIDDQNLRFFNFGHGNPARE